MERSLAALQSMLGQVPAERTLAQLGLRFGGEQPAAMHDPFNIGVSETTKPPKPHTGILQRTNDGSPGGFGDEPIGFSYENRLQPQPDRSLAGLGNRVYGALTRGSHWLIDSATPFVPPELRNKVRGLGELINMANPATAYRDYNAAAREGRYGEAALNAFGLVPGEALVTGAAKLVAAPLVPASKKISDLWHRISEIKLRRPVAEMSAQHLPTGPVTERVISPEALQGGILLPAIGDRSAAGQSLVKVGDGPPLAVPVDLQGGHGFMAANVDRGHVWASNKGVVSTMANRARTLAEKEGAPVYLPFTAMGERAVDFSHHVSDTLAEMIKDARIVRRAPIASDFDRAMKMDRRDFKGDPSFPGIKSPDLREYLASAPGAVRNKFAKLMDTAKYQDAGFPSVAEARFAVTDPRLLNEPIGAAGLSISRVGPGAITEPSTHRTYNTALRGDYVGGLGQSVPREIMYPDIVTAYARQGFHPQGLDFLMLRGRAPVFQRADQQWLDNLMKYIQEPK
jgi:hypothetical protein